MPENLLPIESLKPLVGKERKGGGGIMSLQLPVFLESTKKGQKKLGCYIQQKTFKKSNF